MIDDLVATARGVLDRNWSGRSTVPAAVCIRTSGTGTRDSSPSAARGTTRSGLTPRCAGSSEPSGGRAGSPTSCSIQRFHPTRTSHRPSAALAEIAATLGEDGAEFAQDAARITRAIEAKLWDEGASRFLPFDVRRGRPTAHHSIVSFMPLVAPGIDPAKARATVQAMESFRHCDRSPCHLLPTYESGTAGFDPRQYWRGPIWVNTNWLLSRGCRGAGADEPAEELRESVFELVRAHGFREYFHPHGTAGYGADRFSWTAALFLDLALEGQGRRDLS